MAQVWSDDKKSTCSGLGCVQTRRGGSEGACPGTQGDLGGRPQLLPSSLPWTHLLHLSIWGSGRRAWCGLPGSGMQPRNRNRAPGQALSPGRGEGRPGAGGGGRRSNLRTRTLPTPPALLLQLPLHIPRLGFVFCGLVLRKQQPANRASLHSLPPESAACVTHWASRTLSVDPTPAASGPGEPALPSPEAAGSRARVGTKRVVGAGGPGVLARHLSPWPRALTAPVSLPAHR